MYQTVQIYLPIGWNMKINLTIATKHTSVIKQSRHQWENANRQTIKNLFHQIVVIYTTKPALRRGKRKLSRSCE